LRKASFEGHVSFTLFTMKGSWIEMGNDGGTITRAAIATVISGT